MKIRPLLVVLFSLVIGTVYAQNNFKQVNPDITYTVSPSKYVLGGLVVDGVSGFDRRLGNRSHVRSAWRRYVGSRAPLLGTETLLRRFAHGR